METTIVERSRRLGASAIVISGEPLHWLGVPSRVLRLPPLQEQTGQSLVQPSLTRVFYVPTRPTLPRPLGWQLFPHCKPNKQPTDQSELIMQPCTASHARCGHRIAYEITPRSLREYVDSWPIKATYVGKLQYHTGYYKRNT